MFARHFSVHLKPNSVAEFTRLIEQETLPLLRKQKGFQDEMTFVVPGGPKPSESCASWDQVDLRSFPITQRERSPRLRSARLVSIPASDRALRAERRPLG
jgi:hypothetical protein